MLIIGVLQVELSIPWADSLKDKRRAIKGLKEKVKNRFNVSIAEVDQNDVWRTAILGVAAVITMVSLGEGSKQEALLQIERLGDQIAAHRHGHLGGGSGRRRPPV